MRTKKDILDLIETLSTVKEMPYARGNKEAFEYGIDLLKWVLDDELELYGNKVD